MDWVKCSEQQPMMCQEVVIERKDGSHAVAYYAPWDEKCWVVSMTDEHEHYYFVVSVARDDVKKWSPITYTQKDVED